MNTISSSPKSRRPVAAICAVVCGLAATLAAADKKEPLPENYIDISFGHVQQEGDRPGFQKATQLKKDGYGGIEDLHYTGSLSDTTTYLLEGHALAGNQDYLFDLTFTNEELGHLKFGYERYRVYYDGTGGYLPSRMFALAL